MFDDRDFHFEEYNVRYIPELKRKLISIMFDGIGCTRIERGVMRISHGALVIAKRV
jgi:hypothetical protein